jgi:hypothetical protein
MRWKLPATARAIAFTSRVLPARKQRYQRQIDSLVLADDHAAQGLSKTLRSVHDHGERLCRLSCSTPRLCLAVETQCRFLVHAISASRKIIIG